MRSFTPATLAAPQAAPGIREEPAVLPSEQIDTAEESQQDASPADISSGIDEAESEYAEIADPLAPLNRVMFHVNDKLYFWLLKPVSQVYSYVMPEYFRTGFSNAYDNLKAPGRLINNLLQLRLKAAGTELARFLCNSTAGIGGFGDVARDALGIRKQEADFGQTLGHYGIGHGFYIVWPVFGPSSLRDTVGFAGDALMHPLTYISGSDLPLEARVGISAHEKVNDTSFKIGDYESFKKAAVDPYFAMRDLFVQYRKKKIEESDPLFK
jgi:phospholipid-binding lipoprotein MlaA